MSSKRQSDSTAGATGNLQSVYYITTCANAIKLSGVAKQVTIYELTTDKTHLQLFDELKGVTILNKQKI